MAARTQIPEAQGVADKKVREILTTIRTILNSITGRTSAPVKQLGADANLGGVINKVNEIIRSLQELPQTQSNIPTEKEEDTNVWTPTDASGAGLTFTNPVGTYFKSGRLVIAHFSLAYPATANGSNASIGGLPYEAGNYGPGAIQGFYGGITTGTASRGMYGAGNGSTFNFDKNNGAALLTNADLSGVTIYGTVMYKTA